MSWPAIPTARTARAILKALPAAGADVIEFGMPFTDPMADGPSVQAAGLRALAGGQTLAKTLEDIAWFRKDDQATPIVLMGYYNPIYIYGVDRFLADAKAAGIDGLIVVDLPPEEDAELCIPALKAASTSFAWRRRRPMTSACRRCSATRRASSTTTSPSPASPARRPRFRQDGRGRGRIKRHTDLPVAVGFGVKNADHASAVARGADAVVVGSALVDALKGSLDGEGKATARTVSPP